MLLGIQIVGVVFGIFMLYITFLHGKRKEFSSKESIFWVIAWLLLIILIVAPNALDFISRDILNISRTLDFLMIVAFMFLIGISFYNYSLVKKNQNKLETIVRKLAFKKR